MTSNFRDILIAVVLVVLAILLLDPLDFFMPSAAQMTILVAFLVLFAVFIGLIWREKAADERENLHRLIAGRLGYILGASGLVIGIVIQSFSHEVDPWLVIGLVLMVIGKILGFIHSRSRF